MIVTREILENNFKILEEKDFSNKERYETILNTVAIKDFNNIYQEIKEIEQVKLEFPLYVTDSWYTHFTNNALYTRCEVVVKQINTSEELFEYLKKIGYNTSFPCDLLEYALKEKETLVLNRLSSVSYCEKTKWDNLLNYNVNTLLNLKIYIFEKIIHSMIKERIDPSLPEKELKKRKKELLKFTKKIISCINRKKDFNYSYDFESKVAYVISKYMNVIKNDRGSVKKFYELLEMCENILKNKKGKISQKNKSLIAQVFNIVISKNKLDKKYLKEKDFYYVNNYLLYEKIPKHRKNVVYEIFLKNIETLHPFLEEIDLSHLVSYGTPFGTYEVLLKIKKGKHFDIIDHMITDLHTFKDTFYSGNSSYYKDKNKIVRINELYIILSNYNKKNLDKTNINVLASYLLLTKFYEYIPRYYIEKINDSFLTKKENMDILAERIIKELRKDPKKKEIIKTILSYDEDIRKAYFYKALYNALINSDDISIKKTIIDIGLIG